MRERERKLLRRRLDVEMRPYRRARTGKHQSAGLLRAIRQALRIPIAEITVAMGVNRSGVYDMEAREEEAIAALRKLATALESYRRAYGKLPDALEPLGPAPKGGISPEAAGLIDADLSAGNKDGYAIRYRIVPAAGNLPEEDANQAAKFELAATPIDYGKAGRRSFFLDSGGILRGADKQGAVATSADPRMASP